MWAIRGALGLVLAAAVLLAGFGLVAGLTTDATAGVSGRPFLYWLIGLANLGVSLLFWPMLLSWFMELELPYWHRMCFSRAGQPRLERVRTGRTIVALARSVDPARRLGLAAGVLGYGLFSVFLSLLVPVLFGMAGTRIGRLELWEAVPLALAFWVPLVWIVRLALRSRQSSKVSPG